MVHYIRYGLVQSNYFLTGPQIVDASNADDVARLAAEGVR
jgi:simple sugar transport system substrate-binding protein